MQVGYLLVKVTVLFVIYFIGILGIRWLFQKRNPTHTKSLDWLIVALLLGWTIAFIKASVYMVRLTSIGP